MTGSRHSKSSESFTTQNCQLSLNTDSNPHGHKAPSLAVVVIGLNEAGNLPRCLESVMTMFEHAKTCIGDAAIIYVDSGSTDNSLEVASRYTNHLLSLTSKPSAAAARQAGANYVDTELILFLDGDMTVDPHWLSTALKHEKFDKEGAAGITGTRNDTIVDKNQFVSKRHNVYGVTKTRRAPHIGGAVLLKRSALLEAGGYDAHLKTGEEPDLYARIIARGKYIVELPVPFIDHYTPPKSSLFNRLRTQISNPYFALCLLKSIRHNYFFGFAYVYKLRILVAAIHLSALLCITTNNVLGALVLEVLLIILLKKEKRLGEWVTGATSTASLLFQLPRLFSLIKYAKQESSVEATQVC